MPNNPTLLVFIKRSQPMLKRILMFIDCLMEELLFRPHRQVMFLIPKQYTRNK